MKLVDEVLEMRSNKPKLSKHVLKKPKPRVRRKLSEKVAHSRIAKKMEVMSRNTRLTLQRRTLDRFWEELPEGGEELIRCMKMASKPVMFAGEIVSEQPDWWMRIQAFDRIARHTITPVVEQEDIRPPIIIYAALQGFLGESLAEAGVLTIQGVKIPPALPRGAGDDDASTGSQS